ncbi:MAG: ABC transporter ATP-binding protein [Oscillospiraceae bacterium]|jgi:multiple sugar transport system ATP-binding protein|nr:ABC transporter ATP-binding protein [Oscillospiraceae bacterium]MCI8942320.1 ABC transporter ATP-binding protein [Oscillospiraceae bacterium]
MDLTLKDLTKQFGTTTAVDRVNLTIPGGKLTGLLGPSGCGKSTMLYMISGLLNATEGQILFGDRDVTTLPPDRRNIGLVFQNYALYPHMTVFENIAFPLGNKRGAQKMSKAQMRDAVERVAELVQIQDFMKRRPKELSGGQQQRVAIARALVKEPDVLLLDEPLSNLDARLRMEMRQEVRRIQLESKVTTIFVTHDQEEAMSITDLIVLMKWGVVQQVGPAHEIYMNPHNDFVASFMGNPPITYVDVTAKDGAVTLPGGAVLPVPGCPEGTLRMGIRPEAWTPGKTIGVRLDHVEMRGQDQIVDFTLGGTRITATLDAEYEAAAGKEMFLDIRPTRCYFFDPETGKRLLK